MAAKEEYGAASNSPGSLSLDAQPTILQLTHLIAPSGKKVEIIKHIAARWKTVGIHFNFDPTGYTIDTIAVSNQLNPVACCTDMMKEWLGGGGRQPATWTTLLKILRNAEFAVLADDVEELVLSSVRQERVGEGVSVSTISHGRERVEGVRKRQRWREEEGKGKDVKKQRRGEEEERKGKGVRKRRREGEEEEKGEEVRKQKIGLEGEKMTGIGRVFTQPYPPTLSGHAAVEVRGESQETSSVEETTTAPSQPTTGSAACNPDSVRAREIAEQAAQLQDKFVNVVMHTNICCVKKEAESRVFLKEFRRVVKTLPLSNRNQQVHFLEEEKDRIKMAKDVEEILDILEPYWNYKDYAFLERVIKEVGTSELKKEMKDYITELEQFEKNTSVKDYNSAALEKIKIPAHFQKLAITQLKDPAQCSLYEVRQLKNEIVNRTTLTGYSVLWDVHCSSVVIVLAFPPEAYTELSKVLDEQFMETHQLQWTKEETKKHTLPDGSKPTGQIQSSEVRVRRHPLRQRSLGSVQKTITAPPRATVVSASTTIPSNLLDTQITDQDIAIIARDYLVRWEELSPHLGLTVPQEESIRSTFRVYGDQKREALRMWKRNKGNEATYHTFITAAETSSNRQLADDVRAILESRNISTAAVPSVSTQSSPSSALQPHPPTLPGDHPSAPATEDRNKSEEKPEADQVPTLPELLRLKIPQHVGADYKIFGTFLLNDKTGSRVNSIRKAYLGYPRDIVTAILEEWVAGRGKSCTWQTLINTLRDCELNLPADLIEEALI